MEYKGYHASFEYDSDDDFFVGEVFGIADSLNFHGSSVAELKEMFHQCIDNYLDFCKTINKAPEKEYSGSFNIRVSPDMHRDLALRAYKENDSLNGIAKKAFRAYLSTKQEKETQIIIYGYVPSNMIAGNDFKEAFSAQKEDVATWSSWKM